MAGQGRAGQGWPGQGRAGLAWAGQGKPLDIDISNTSSDNGADSQVSGPIWDLEGSEQIFVCPDIYPEDEETNMECGESPNCIFADPLSDENSHEDMDSLPTEEPEKLDNSNLNITERAADILPGNECCYNKENTNENGSFQ